MPTAFPSLEQLAQPQRLDAMDTPTASIDATPATKPAAQPIKNEVIPSQLSTLSQQGSNISTLGQILAWVAALKGDFRGLQAIEENKRMTALGKSLHPRMLKINELTTSGKWEDAATETEAVVGEYGPAAKEMIPYFNEIRKNIRDKQEGWEQLKGAAARAADIIKPGDIRYPVVEMLQKAVERRDVVSQSMVEAELAKLSNNAQVINNRAYFTNAATQQVATQPLPESSRGSDFNNFTGMNLTSKYNLPSAEALAGVVNGVPTARTDGSIIQPGSPEAIQIKQENSAMLPLQARIDAAKTLNLDPARMWQLLKDSGFMATLTRDLGPGAAERIEKDYMDFSRRTAEATTTGQTEATLKTDPRVAQQLNVINIDGNPLSPSFLRPLGPMTQAQITARGSQVIQPDQKSYYEKVQPNLFHIDALNLIPTMLQGNLPETRSSRVTQWINDNVSAYLGTAVTPDSEIRQNARAILAKAIQQAESLNTLDSQEIGTMRRFATSTFNTNEEMIKASQYVKERLGLALQRSLGGMLPQGAPMESQPPTTVRGKPTVQQPQRTQSSGKPISTIPPELDQQLQEAEAAARRGEVAPNTTVLSPRGTVQQPAPVTQPTVQQKPLTAEERVKKAFELKKQKAAQDAEAAAAQQKETAAALAERIRAQEAAAAQQQQAQQAARNAAQAAEQQRRAAIAARRQAETQQLQQQAAEARRRRQQQGGVLQGMPQ